MLSAFMLLQAQSKKSTVFLSEVPHTQSKSSPVKQIDKPSNNELKWEIIKLQNLFQTWYEHFSNMAQTSYGHF